MLVLTRHRDESVILTLPDGSRVVVLVVKIIGDKCRLGFEAGPEIEINRREVQDKIDRDGANGRRLINRSANP